MIRKDSYACPVAHENLTFADNAGLTKREYFAAIAMQGYVARNDYQDYTNIAVASVEQADALIKALNEIHP